MKTRVKELYSEISTPRRDDWPFTRYEARLICVGKDVYEIAIIHLVKRIQNQYLDDWRCTRIEREIIDLYESEITDAALIRRAISAFDEFQSAAPDIRNQTEYTLQETPASQD